MYIKRDMENVVKQLAKEYACILITGPRQVGKTTMLEHIEPNRSVVTLDDLQERNLAKTDPEMFLQVHKAPLIIDEVQYAPELFSYLKIAIDRGAAPGSYWLTGSQSFKLMNLVQESLAGRIAILELTTFSQHELYSSGELKPFNLELSQLQEAQKKCKSADVNEIYERIFTGGLPALCSGKYSNRDIYFSSYLQTYLSRDVKDELSIKDDARFIDFIRASACMVGQQLNIHSLATDVGVSDDTAKRWLDMLEKSEVIYFLHPYSNNLLKRTVKLPKLYFFDTGLVSYLTRHHTAEILQFSSINGAILENYIVGEIRKSYLNSGLEPLMYYYRDKDQNEIDLILEYDNKLHPIEIKKTANPNLAMIKSFKVIEKAPIKVGKGGVICMKDALSALDSENLIIPAWLV